MSPTALINHKPPDSGSVNARHPTTPAEWQKLDDYLDGILQATMKERVDSVVNICFDS